MIIRWAHQLVITIRRNKPQPWGMIIRWVHQLVITSRLTNKKKGEIMRPVGTKATSPGQSPWNMTHRGDCALQGQKRLNISIL